MRLKPVLLAALLLLSGTLIYVCFRQDAWAVSAFLPSSWRMWLRMDAGRDAAWFRYFAYNLPDALWYAALLSAQSAVAQPGGQTWLRVLTVSLPFCLEGMQAAGLMRGTFDPLDILSYSLILIIYIIYQLLCKTKRKSAQP